MRRLLIFLALLALALRVWYCSINPLLPQFSNADDGDYYQRALRLVMTGQYVDDAWLIRPPLHVWFFAACLKTALWLGQPVTTGVRIVQGVQSMLGAAMVFLGYGVVSRLFGNRRAGLVFAAFWAVWFPFIDLASTLFSEPLYLFLFTLHLWFLLRFDANGRLRELVWAGLVLGGAALTRSPALYALAFAGPWLMARAWRQHPTWRRRLLAAGRPLAVLAVATLLVVGPWTARNWVVYQRFIPVDTLGPINLWLDLGETTERDRKIALLRTLPQADRQAYASTQARAILAADPLRPFRPMWQTFRAIIKAQFIEDFWVKRTDFGRALRPVAPLGLLGDALWLSFTVAGLWRLLHPTTDRAFKWVTAAWLLYSVATVLVFHVEPRYLLSIWLILAMYGASAISNWNRTPPQSPPSVQSASSAFPSAQSSPNESPAAPPPPILKPPIRSNPFKSASSAFPSPRRFLALAIPAAVLALFFSYRPYPTIIGRGLQRERAFAVGEQAWHANDYAGAERGYRAALAVQPDYIDATVALAAALGAQGRAAEGAALLDAGASRASGVMLGALLRDAGQTGAAATLLSEGERIANVDAQRWALTRLRPLPSTALVLGSDLDVGYLAGFAPGEVIAGRTLRWLLGTGEVRLPLPAPLSAGRSVALEIAAPIALTGPLHVQINDGPWQAVWPRADWRSYHLPIPPEAVGASNLHLRLRAPTVSPWLRDPATPDPRTLSVMLHRVVIE